MHRGARGAVGVDQLRRRHADRATAQDHRVRLPRLPGCERGYSLLLLAAFVEALRNKQQPGAAVLVSSVVGHIGVANHEAISVAKAAVAGLVRAAAATYAPNRIRVNGVSPAFMHTPSTASLIASDAAREGFAKQYPLGGIGSVDEVAQAIAWLISPAASRITGQVLPIDGGFTAVRPLVR